MYDDVCMYTVYQSKSRVEGTKAMCYVCYCTREKEVQKVQILQFEYI